MSSDCIVCIERFNKSTKKPVECPYCQVQICRTCIQTCLLQDPIPQCQMPECRKPWSEEFLYSMMTKVFMDGPYCKRKERLLLEQEKARLPETQREAAKYMEGKAVLATITPQIERIRTMVAALPSSRNATKLLHNYDRNRFSMTHAQRADIQQLIYNAKQDVWKESVPLQKELLKLKRLHKYSEHKRHADHYGLSNTVRGVPTEAKNWTHVGKCPVTDCEGFISLEYACGLCKVTVCKDCMESCSADHLCDTNKVENIKALKKEAKPCPKCAAQISKIDGCDQMWCTQCHTAFSWRTGAIENRVHNPHYYEWMRRNGQNAPRAEPVIAGAECGGLWSITQRASVLCKSFESPSLGNAIQQLRHVDVADRQQTQQNLLRLRTTHNEERRRLRVRRLAKEIMDEGWQIPLQRMQKHEHYLHDIQQVYEMYVQTGTDILSEFIRNADERQDVSVNSMAQLSELRDYANIQLRRLGNRYTKGVRQLQRFVRIF